MKTNSGGYVGLVVILVATTILVFLYFRTELSPTPQQVVTETENIETTTTQTQVQVAHKNIDTAKAMQEKTDKQNQELNKALGE